MSTDANLAGYAVYLCEILVPGVGLGELLGAWGGARLSLMQRVGLAVGLGISVDTVVLAVRTSGVVVAGHRLAGVDAGTLYFIIVIGLAALLASLAYRRKLLLPVRPTTSDAAVAVVMAALAVVVWLFYQKYPFFPEFPRPDFGVHLQIAEGLVSGSMVSIPRGILYYGVHYQLASTLVLVGGAPFVTVQRTMGILVILSPLVVYLGASKIFSSLGAGFVAVALYVFSGAVWFDSVFDSGLYANFFGLLFALFFVVALLELSERMRSVQAWALFAVVVAASYFSHYTIITVLPGILAVAVIQLLRRNPEYKRLLVALLATAAPAALVVAVRPRLVHLLVYFAESSGGALTGSTTLSAALAFLPSLSYLVLELNDDIGFAFLVFFSCVYAYKAYGLRAATMFIPLVWVLALIAAAPQNVSAWRYSYEALLPLVLMASYGVYSLLPRLKIQKRKSGRSNAEGQYARVGLVLALLFVPLVLGSWGTAVLVDESSSVQVQAQSQQEIYAAMTWLNSSTPANSTYLSLTDWRFLYTSLLIGRNTTYQYVGSESQAIAYAQQQGMEYIIVTHLTTVSLPLPSSEYPWFTFQPSANVTMVYSNDDVKVFQLT